MGRFVCGVMNLRGSPCLTSVSKAGDRCEQHVGVIDIPLQDTISTLAQAIQTLRGKQGETWFREALCRTLPPDQRKLFHGHSNDPAKQAHIEQQAKSICAKCDSQKACLQYALQTMQEHGIWGGATEGERRQLRNKRRSQKAS